MLVGKQRRERNVKQQKNNLDLLTQDVIVKCMLLQTMNKLSDPLVFTKK